MDNKLLQKHLVVGESVRYQPDYYGKDEWENGIVKEIPKSTTRSVRVVYSCGGRWHMYQEFPSVMTRLEDLKKGWK